MAFERPESLKDQILTQTGFRAEPDEDTVLPALADKLETPQTTQPLSEPIFSEPVDLTPDPDSRNNPPPQIIQDQEPDIVALTPDLDTSALSTQRQIQLLLSADRQRVSALEARAPVIPLEHADKQEGPANIFGAESFLAGRTAARTAYNLNQLGNNSSNSNENKEAKAKDEEKKLKDDLDLYLMISDQIKNIDKQIADLDKRIRDDEKALCRLDPRNRQLLDEKATVQEKLDFIRQRKSELGNEFKNTKLGIYQIDRQMDSLLGNMNPALTEKYKAYQAAQNENIVSIGYKGPGDTISRQYAVYKDPKGYYIKGAQGNIYITDEHKLRWIERQQKNFTDPSGNYHEAKLLGDQNPTAATALDKASQEWLTAEKQFDPQGKLTSLQQRRDSLQTRQHDIIEQQIALDKTEADLQKRFDAIKGELGATPEGRRLLADIDAAEAQKRNLEIQKQQFLQDQQNLSNDIQNLTKGLPGNTYNSFDDFLTSLNPQERQLFETLNKYDNRHEFMQKNVLEKSSAYSFIKNESNILRDAQDNYVYYDYKTQEVYRLKKDESGAVVKDAKGNPVREYYKDFDPAQVDALRAKAWNEKNIRIFRNEATDNAASEYDTTNTWSMTKNSKALGTNTIKSEMQTSVASPANKPLTTAAEQYDAAAPWINGPTAAFNTAAIGAQKSLTPAFNNKPVAGFNQ